MEKQKNTQMLVIAVLAVAVLTMSVGFAAFSQRLNITGNTVVKATTWNIAFDTESYSESTGSVAAANHTLNGTSMTYEATLNKPGDFYEFTVTVKNTGSFDANLTGITMTALTAEQQKYLTYTVTYAGTDYTASASNLTTLLAKTSGTATVKVKIAYIQPENPEDLPTNADVTVSLSASLDYTQVE